MKCSQISNRLSSFLDGEATETEKFLITEHLKSCANCQKERENFSQVSDLLELVTEVEVSPYFISRVKPRISAGKVRRVLYPSFFDWVKRLSIPVGIAALFIISILGGNYLGQRFNLRAAKEVELNEAIANVTGITSFEDFSENSLDDAYAELLFEGDE